MASQTVECIDHEIEKVEMSDHDQFVFDPLECSDTASLENDSANIRQSTTISNIVKAVIKTLNMKPPSGEIRGEDEDTNTVKKCKRRKSFLLSRVSGERKRARFANETAEERQFRLLRMRMVLMKKRLLKRLEMPEAYKEQQDNDTERRRLEKRRIYAKETAEEAEERKRRNREQIRLSRQRIREIETPEQKIERNIKKSLQRKATKLMETPEQREARLEKMRCYMRQQRQTYDKTQNTKKVSAKTGKIYIRERNTNGKSNEEQRNEENEAPLNAAGCTGADNEEII